MNGRPVGWCLVAVIDVAAALFVRPFEKVSGKKKKKLFTETINEGCM